MRDDGSCKMDSERTGYLLSGMNCMRDDAGGFDFRTILTVPDDYYIPESLKISKPVRDKRVAAMREELFKQPYELQPE